MSKKSQKIYLDFARRLEKDFICLLSSIICGKNNKVLNDKRIGNR